MKIVVFEGLDKAGKRTQATLLEQALVRKGLCVVRSEFHRYDTPTGKLIRQFLDGKYKVNQLAIEAIMAADKYAQLDWMNRIADEGTDVLILDRYTLSQSVYGAANGVCPGFLYSLLEELPEPDYTVYLDINPLVSMQRKGEHGSNDVYEKDFPLLDEVRNRYIEKVSFQASDELASLHDAELDRGVLSASILAKVSSYLRSEGYDL